MQRNNILTLLTAAALLQGLTATEAAATDNVDSRRDDLTLIPSYDPDTETAPGQKAVLIYVRDDYFSHNLHSSVTDKTAEQYNVFDLVDEPDLNFDGNNDLTVYVGKTAEGDIYDAFLWDPTRRHFVHAPQYRDIPNPTVDPLRFGITGKVYYNPDSIVENVYAWDDAQLNLVESSCYGSAADISEPDTESQTDNVVSMILTDHNGPYTNVRNAPRGKVVGKISTDNVASLVLCQPTNGWWRIVDDKVYYDEDDTSETLSGSDTGYWVYHSVVGASTRNYGNRRIGLREQPRNDAHVSYWFSDERLLHPLDVKGNWVKVVTDDGAHTGWIHIFWLCSNPLTTCP